MSARLRPRRYYLNKGSMLDCTHRLSSLSHELVVLSCSSLSFLVLLCLQLSFLCVTVSKEECLISDRLGFRGSGCRIVLGINTIRRNSLFVLASTSSVTLTEVFSGAVEEQNCMDLHIRWYGYRNPPPKYRHLCTSRLSRQALKTYGLILTQQLS